MNLSKNIFNGLMLVLAVSLYACGGGGASTTSTENELPSPVPKDLEGEDEVPDEDGQSPVTPDELQLLPKINLGGAQYADPNVLVTLNASVQAAEGAQITATLWTQVSGPAVRIPNPSELRNLVLLPDVSVATTVEFRFIAEDSEGRINSVTTSILIKPVPTFVKVIGGVFDEADEQAVFKIVLNAPSELPVNVTYVTRSGAALEGEDFNPVSGALVFQPGEISKEVLVNLVNDEIEETDESFSLQVIALNGESTHANSGIVIIRNGAEPQLDQEIRFSNAGPVIITVSQTYTNPLDPAVVPPGSGNVIYVTSDPIVATVNSDGLITPVSLGVAQITVIKFGDAVYRTTQDTFELQITADATLSQEIRFVEAGPITIYVGETYTNPLDSSVVSPGTGAITYSSLRASVATVNETTGEITAVAEGFTQITVTKAADANYPAAEDSFVLEVVFRGESPDVSLERLDSGGSPMPFNEPIYIQSGEVLTLRCTVNDPEDGIISESSTLSSNINGVIGAAGFLETSTLPLGDHEITCAATDSDGNNGSAARRVIVGNVAPAGNAFATSTYCTSGEPGSASCYDVTKINDGDLNVTVGGEYSWTNPEGDLAGETYVSISWETPVTITGMQLYSTVNFVMRTYDIEYFDPSSDSWILLDAVNENASNPMIREFTPVTINELRILVRSGSTVQPQYGRINEVVIFGVQQTFTES